MENLPDANIDTTYAVIGPFLESPVPGDDHLPEDELPFTAFGQFGAGNIDLRVFEQDKYWVDDDGTPHLLDEMEPEYLFNVLAFIFGQVEHFYVGMLNRVTVEVLFMDNTPTQDDIVFKRVRSLINGKPMEWLNSTVLVRRLNLLLDQHRDQS